MKDDQGKDDLSQENEDFMGLVIELEDDDPQTREKAELLGKLVCEMNNWKGAVIEEKTTKGKKKN